MKSKEVEEFLKSALHYCNFIDLFTTYDEVNKLNKLLVSLTELYSRALLLTEVEPINEQVASIHFAIPLVVFEQHERYWEVFDPYHLDEPVSGNLTDDILDIYRDVKEGILRYERDEHIEAIWHWKFTFETHWGHHAVDAIRALHSVNFS